MTQTITPDKILEIDKTYRALRVNRRGDIYYIKYVVFIEEKAYCLTVFTRNEHYQELAPRTKIKLLKEKNVEFTKYTKSDFHTNAKGHVSNEGDITCWVNEYEVFEASQMQAWILDIVEDEEGGQRTAKNEEDDHEPTPPPESEPAEVVDTRAVLEELKREIAAKRQEIEQINDMSTDLAHHKEVIAREFAELDERRQTIRQLNNEIDHESIENRAKALQAFLHLLPEDEKTKRFVIINLKTYRELLEEHSAEEIANMRFFLTSNNIRGDF